MCSLFFCNASLFDTLNNDNGVVVAKTLSWPWDVRELRSSMQAVRDGEAYAQVIMRDVVQEADSMQCLGWIKTFHQKLVSIIDTVLAGADACLKDLAGKVEQSLDSLGVESERADMEKCKMIDQKLLQAISCAKDNLPRVAESASESLKQAEMIRANAIGFAVSGGHVS